MKKMVILSLLAAAACFGQDNVQERERRAQQMQNGITQGQMNEERRSQREQYREEKGALKEQYKQGNEALKEQEKKEKKEKNRYKYEYKNGEEKMNSSDSSMRNNGSRGSRGGGRR